MELALKHPGDAIRVVYALQIDNDIWIIHAFPEKVEVGDQDTPSRKSTWCGGG